MSTDASATRLALKDLVDMTREGPFPPEGLSDLPLLSERRTSQRVRLTGLLSFRVIENGLPSAKAHAGFTSDVSQSGLGFFSPVPLAKDTELMLEASLGGEAVAVGRGRVVHCRPATRDIYVVGVELPPE